MSHRSWSLEQLQLAVRKSKSYRAVLKALNLVPAGGNYLQIQKYVKQYKLDCSHFTGKLWNKGMRGYFRPRIPLEGVLIENSDYQSFKLKRRLFREGLKQPCCEMCGWAVKTPDGYLPLELDHINGDHRDNRLLNLRILCPNCHSLQPTHRGRRRT